MQVIPAQQAGPLYRYTRYAGPVVSAGAAFRMGDYAARKAASYGYRAYKYGQAAYNRFTTKSKSAAAYSRSKKGPRKFPKTLKKQVRELKRLAESDMGTLVYRYRTISLRSAAVGQSTLNSLSGMTMSNYEAALAQLRYYDPSNPGTLLTAAGATGTFQKDFLINKSYSKYTAYNNYQTPAKVTLYICVPKSDTSITPQNAFTNGLTDIGAPSSTNVLIHPTDSQEFNDIWKIVKSKTKLIQPGSSLTITHSVKPFQYDPALFDSHTLNYQKKSGCFTCMIRIEGPVGHDTSAAEYTNIAASVELEEIRVIEVKYSAGADIKTVYVEDAASSSFTNGGVVSSKPVSDNIGYSVS